MSEGADSITQTCENSLTTLKPEDDPENLPPRTISYTGRRPRFGTGNVKLSPYILIDGKKLRSSLSLSKKWPPRRVSFPTNDSHLVTGYLEPANPWRLAENVNRDDLILAYKESCIRHNTDPLESVIDQLENLEISENRSDQLILKGETLDQNRSEPLEEILKRIQFRKVDLERTSLDEESSVILFDMLEYYESARHLNISCNQDIGIRGWQACAHMIKKTQCLEQLEAKDVTLNEQYMNILSRALRLVCHLHVLKLENCGLSGSAIVILVTALKMNAGIRELYLADNGLNLYDAIQLGSLLRLNNHIQLLDISNNNIQDDGVRDILEGLINQINEDKDGKGLSILVLWNNRLTKKASPYFSRIIALSKTLETLNIGQNMLTDETLVTVKDALKKNRILLQLGMQSTDLTCDGIVTLSEIIETNQVLQRIDLRDNSIQMTGMRALCSAMKKNKSITQIDLDDKPRMKIDGTLHQYMELVAEVRDSCLQNEKSRKSEENTEGSESPQHHSRLCSASSRKISLTCQTLPCSSPSTTTPIQSDGSGRSMLEPKRASGGRLRSPAPSPIPSPVASPIPSPSRSRFVVSRVPEASLRSTDSSASSSPVNPPSLGSSPTCFFPSASGSSRFRVSVVESASTVPSPKSVVASSKANVTIGFKFNLETLESNDSDDSDNAFRSELGASNEENPEDGHGTSGDVSHLVQSVALEETAGAEEISTNKSSREEATSEVRFEDSVITERGEERCEGLRDNQSNIPIRLECDALAENAEHVENYNTESTKASETHVNIDEDKMDSSCALVNDELINHTKTRDATKVPTCAPSSETVESQTKQNSSLQKHTSNLEKLLALFQHPSSFFSDSTCINQMESGKSTFQDSVSSMMAFGDKFHHYLKEGRDKVNNHGAVSWSSEESSLPVKNKSTKSSNITQLSSLQSLTSMFSSFKLDANLNLFEQSTKSCSKLAENVNSSLKKDDEKDLTGIQEEDEEDRAEFSGEDTESNVYIKEDETTVSASRNQSLPEDVQSKVNDGHTNKDLVLDENCVASSTPVAVCSTIVNNSPFFNVPESKTTVSIPKLMDIPEYSVLDITENNVKEEGVDQIIVDKVDSILVDETCDKTLTDSINPTSDSNPSSCNITCDIRVMNDVHIVNTNEGTHDSVALQLSAKEDTENSTVFNSYDKPNDLASFVCNNDRDFNVNNVSLVYHDALTVAAEETDCVANQVTSLDNNNDKEVFVADPREDPQNTDSCHVDNITYWKSTTTVNSTTMESGLSGISLISKSSNVDFNSEEGDSRTSNAYKNELTDPSQDQKILDNEAHRAILKEPKNNNSFIASTTADNKLEKNFETILVPTVTLSHHKTPLDIERVEECPPDFDKSSEGEDLIFCITDISIDRTPIEENLSPSVASNDWTKDIAKLATPFPDLPQTSRALDNLPIESPEDVHRNSQDSGIGETNLSTLDVNIPESMHTNPRESFQESVDSGIESECSSVCVKPDDSCVAYPKEEATLIVPFAKKYPPDANCSPEAQRDFESSGGRQMQSTNTDANQFALVVDSTPSTEGKDVEDATAVTEIVSDQSNAVLAEPTSSASLRAASPK